MIPWILLDTAAVPGDGGETLRLWRRGDEFSIRLGVAELMNSRLRGSEEALATIPCARLAARAKPRILIGGLGMGFTFRAALGAVGEAEVIVAELSPAVIAWAHGPMAQLFGDSLADPRGKIREGDVRSMMRSECDGFDASLLDVDNGPEAMTRASNESLYGARGLSEARAALKPGGILAVWSSGPDEAFPRRFRKAGFDVEETRMRANGKTKGARHVLWFGTKPNDARATSTR
jgi:spermidine synthase